MYIFIVVMEHVITNMIASQNISNGISLGTFFIVSRVCIFFVIVITNCSLNDLKCILSLVGCNFYLILTMHLLNC